MAEAEATAEAAIKYIQIRRFHTAVVMTVGACDGDKAKKRRRIMIRTGTKRSIDGGGGSDGRSSGKTSSDAANAIIIITMIHLILKKRFESFGYLSGL
ncbi:hypothetical protein GOBAR_DD28838 [Gossypium barbadense]|nr:hypothetical protein GOBAR_DD28838 [Gossypium barbadense]